MLVVDHIRPVYCWAKVRQAYMASCTNENIDLELVRLRQLEMKFIFGFRDSNQGFDTLFKKF